MMRVNNNKDSNFLYIKINGRISKDYYEVISPFFLQKIKEGKEVNLIIELEDFDSFESPVSLNDIGLRIENFNKIAIVGNHEWLRGNDDLKGENSSTEILFFDLGESEKAKNWISGNHT
jgi:hypothetical protein